VPLLTGSRVELIVRPLLAAVLLCAPGGPAPAEPCNPVIHGTYCATQPNPSLESSTYSSRGGYFAPVQGIGRDIGPATDAPATLGGITFRGGGQTCIGLFRRGECS
jgi:hypothetical protein